VLPFGPILVVGYVTVLIALTNALQLRVCLGHGVGRIGSAKHLFDVFLEVFLLVDVQPLKKVLCPGQQFAFLNQGSGPS
jgi:hypothetical protein